MKRKHTVCAMFHHWWVWALLFLPLAALILYLSVFGISKKVLKTEAALPTETTLSFDMSVNQAYTAEDGLVVVKSSKSNVLAAEKQAASPETRDYPSEQIWEQDAVSTYHLFTMPEKVERKDGSLGLLQIPKLGVSANVFETDNQMEDMRHGIAHFKSTSAWQGNIGLSAHNLNFDLTDGYFKNLHQLKKGDKISYATQLGSREYTVTTVAEISDEDWSYLGRTEDNRITLITCITGKPGKRLCVQAMEKK